MDKKISEEEMGQIALGMTYLAAKDAMEEELSINEEISPDKVALEMFESAKKEGFMETLIRFTRKSEEDIHEFMTQIHRRAYKVIKAQE